MKFRIERAGEEDYSSLIHLILEVYEQIPADQKDWFVVDEEEETRRRLETGIAWGYKAVEINSGQLAAVFTAVFTGKTSANLGWDIGLPEAELPLVAHMDTAAVSAAYRGFGLQRQLMEYAERELRQAGYRYLCCTAHPENRYSENNILSQGYQRITTKEKYGGLLRDIFMKRV